MARKDSRTSRTIEPSEFNDLKRIKGVSSAVGLGSGVGVGGDETPAATSRATL